MIYVTIGNEESYGFKRLIEAMDLIAAEIEDEVIFQIGNTSYFPQNGRYFHYTTYIDSIKFFQEARLIVSHCSTGAIINSKKFGKPLLVVPRQKAYGELFDEHQTELARAIEKEGFVRVVYNTEDLRDKVLQILREETGRNLVFPQKPEGIIRAIQTFLVTLPKREEMV